MGELGRGFQEKAIMKCVICKQGETYQGTATITLERAATTLVFKQVPALVCETWVSNT